MRAASFGEGTGARAEVTLLWGGAQFFVLHAALGERVCGGHRAHRRGLVQFRLLLVGHLDQSGLLGGGSNGRLGRKWGSRSSACRSLCAQGRRRSGGHRAHTSLGGQVMSCRVVQGERMESAGRRQGERVGSAESTRRVQAVQAGGAAGPRARSAAPGRRCELDGRVIMMCFRKRARSRRLATRPTSSCTSSCPPTNLRCTG